MTTQCRAGEGIRLTRVLDRLGIAPSSWYVPRPEAAGRRKPGPAPREVAAAVTGWVVGMATTNPWYGYKRIAVMCRKAGQPVSNRQAYRVMKAHRLLLKRKKTKAELLHARKLWELLPAGPNELWQMDVTYLFIPGFGWWYAVTVIDYYSRYLLACHLTMSYEAGAVCTALDLAREFRALGVAVAIGGFYMAGLMWGQHTNLAVAEYWRWWVVHLWVEGFFEVFATVVIIFMFARLQLIRVRTANTAVILSSTVYLAGGIIGTLHHLYFSGTPTPVLALGAVFSALEVVPLVLAGFEAWDNLKLSRATSWTTTYKWPIYFFIAVAFWNMVGAGLFGFMINPPIALYYMQGLNTTPVHGHAALFGVYGMLGAHRQSREASHANAADRRPGSPKCRPAVPPGTDR